MTSQIELPRRLILFFIPVLTASLAITWLPQLPSQESSDKCPSLDPWERLCTPHGKRALLMASSALTSMISHRAEQFVVAEDHYSIVCELNGVIAFKPFSWTFCAFQTGAHALVPSTGGSRTTIQGH